MKYFKDENNVIYAYEADGSQDSYIKPNLIEVSKDEADSIIAQNTVEPEVIEPTKEELLTQLKSLTERIEALEGVA